MRIGLQVERETTGLTNLRDHVAKLTAVGDGPVFHIGVRWRLGVAVEQAAKLELHEQLAAGTPVGVTRPQGVEVQWYVIDLADGRELLRKHSLIRVLGEVATVLVPRQLAGMLDGAFHGTVGLQQLSGPLGADARHTRDVVDAVAHEPEQVRDELRRHSVLLFDRRRGRRCARLPVPHSAALCAG